jgi:hypothetical protein
MSSRQVVNYPKRHYKKWTNTDLLTLENLIGKQYELKEIANRLQRTKEGVLWKIDREFNESITSYYEPESEDEDGEDISDSDSDSDYEPSKPVKYQLKPSGLYLNTLESEEEDLGEIALSDEAEYEYVSESPNAHLEESIEALTQKVWDIETEVGEIKELVSKYFIGSKKKSYSPSQGFFYH